MGVTHGICFKITIWFLDVFVGEVVEGGPALSTKAQALDFLSKYVVGIRVAFKSIQGWVEMTGEHWEVRAAIRKKVVFYQSSSPRVSM